ncbi:sigma-70 family RNA polymerase sigma factor [Streptomyces sp. MAR4 CNX-425]|uniref:sigma-70 family RNA polymerase sigma factor n=1 Tax=Streptomyces sp. MAR4 CNX-425 TaxID=3406343 RepID=UPI003B514F0E
MNEQEFLARRFEEHRRHLRAVAFRVLGSASEAEDAVQEAWLRASRAGAGGVENVAGWLTTIVGRVSLNMLRARATRSEEPLGPVASGGTKRGVGGPDGSGPEEEALLQDSVGLALLVVLDTLAPAERLAFVLHDMFDVPFPEIAPIVERSPTATRQLASRARRRVRDAAEADGAGGGAWAGAVAGVHSDATGAGAAAGASAAAGDSARRWEIVDAFLAASRDGDFEALLALLDPDVVLRADAAAVATGAAGEVRGAAGVAGTFAGRARAARPALVDGTPALVWMRHGQPKIVIGFTITGGVIVGIDLIGEPERLGEVELTPMDG